jgi:hypothetical protein
VKRSSDYRFSVCRDLVEHLGQGISPSQGPNLHRATQIQTHIYATSGIWTYDRCVWSINWPRLQAKCPTLQFNHSTSEVFGTVSLLALQLIMHLATKAAHIRRPVINCNIMQTQHELFTDASLAHGTPEVQCPSRAIRGVQAAHQTKCRHQQSTNKTSAYSYQTRIAAGGTPTWAELRNTDSRQVTVAPSLEYVKFTSRRQLEWGTI